MISKSDGEHMTKTKSKEEAPYQQLLGVYVHMLRSILLPDAYPIIISRRKEKRHGAIS